MTDFKANPDALGALGVDNEGDPKPSGEVGYRLLVGSDGRVAVQFTEPVEFYAMAPHEAFELAQSLLNAAYVARERREGILHPLGQKVLKDEPEEASAKPSKNETH